MLKVLTKGYGFRGLAKDRMVPAAGSYAFGTRNSNGRVGRSETRKKYNEVRMNMTYVDNLSQDVELLSSLTRALDVKPVVKLTDNEKIILNKLSEIGKIVYNVILSNEAGAQSAVVLAKKPKLVVDKGNYLLVSETPIDFKHLHGAKKNGFFYYCFGTAAFGITGFNLITALGADRKPSYCGKLIDGDLRGKYGFDRIDNWGSITKGYIDYTNYQKAVQSGLYPIVDNANQVYFDTSKVVCVHRINLGEALGFVFKNAVSAAKIAVKYKLNLFQCACLIDVCHHRGLANANLFAKAIVHRGVNDMIDAKFLNREGKQVDVFLHKSRINRIKGVLNV